MLRYKIYEYNDVIDFMFFLSIFGSDLGGALYLWMCLSISPRISPWQNSSIFTLKLNNSAPDHLIELKFGSSKTDRVTEFLALKQLMTVANWISSLKLLTLVRAVDLWSCKNIFQIFQNKMFQTLTFPGIFCWKRPWKDF